MDYAEISKTGSRPVNEDSLLFLKDEQRELYCVADGLGGHGRGDEASACAVESLKKSFEEAKDADLTKFLETAFRKANDDILALQAENRAKDEMKTTMTVLYRIGDRLAWAHVGDSRLYVFRKNRVALRSFDHSVPQMLFMAHEIPERKIRNHPDRNILLRVLGIEWERDQFELSDIHDASEYQAFLLCSDGFWELITERRMCWELWKSKSVGGWLTAMTAIVEKNGRDREMDNYTALAVWNDKYES